MPRELWEAAIIAGAVAAAALTVGYVLGWA